MTTRLPAVPRVSVIGPIHLLPPNVLRRAQGHLYLCSYNTVTQQQGSSLPILPADSRRPVHRHKTAHSSTPRKMHISLVSPTQIQQLMLRTPNCQLYTLQATAAHTTHHRTPSPFLKSLQSKISLILILLTPRAVQLSFFRKFNQVPYPLITEIE